MIRNWTVPCQTAAAVHPGPGMELRDGWPPKFPGPGGVRPLCSSSPSPNQGVLENKK